MQCIKSEQTVITEFKFIRHGVWTSGRELCHTVSDRLFGLVAKGTDYQMGVWTSG